MHVYNNSNKGQKILEDRNCIKRETYSPAQTIMLYLELNSAEHLTQTNVLNLVLDQHKRERDLYYNIRVFSQVPFSVNRSSMNFKYTQKIVVPPCAGGGVPSSPLFYQNPQFLISTDRSKIVNWPLVSKVAFDCLFSYTTTDAKTHIKTFLCNSSAGNYRISTINDETVVHMAQKKEPYKPQTNHVRFMLNPEEYYTLVLSSFESGGDLGGILTIESNQPINLRTIGAEGQGMFAQKINGLWDVNTAGGCRNNGALYGKNPAWQVNIKEETEFMMRLAITAQNKDGVTITNPDQFRCCIGMSMFLTDSEQFPLSPNQYNIQKMGNFAVSTNDGIHTWNLSAAVSTKQKIAPGIYILVPTTY